ncbi:MAG: hypothetical protein ACRDTH_10465 [Pseudonocardiaceae bacterium]
MDTVIVGARLKWLGVAADGDAVLVFGGDLVELIGALGEAG